MSYLTNLNNKININASGSFNTDSKQSLAINAVNIKNDLTNISNYINLILYPMFSELPSGESFPNDPAVNGLSGSTIVTYTRSLGNTSNSDSAYWYGSSNGRPKTIKETFDTLINRLRVLESAINRVQTPTIPNLNDIYDNLNLLRNYIRQLFVESYGAQTNTHSLNGVDNPTIPDFTFSSLLYQVYTQLITGQTSESLSILDASSHQDFVLKINKAAIELLFDDLIDVNVSTAVAEQSIVFDGTNWVNQKIQLDGNTEGNYVKSVSVSSDLIRTETHAHGNEYSIGLSDTGVDSGDYFKVTVDSKGRVTSGENPTTLEGFGITDAVNSNLIGEPNGIAPLNESSKIDSQYLPSYVDDVLEYDDLESFPEVGETGKIYIAKDTNNVYRWATTVYVEISPGSPNSLVGLSVISPIIKSGDSTNPTIGINASSANNFNYVVQRDSSGIVSVSRVNATSFVAGNVTLNTSGISTANGATLSFQASGNPITVYGATTHFTTLNMTGGSSDINFTNAPSAINFSTYDDATEIYQPINFNTDAVTADKDVKVLNVVRPGTTNSYIKWDEANDKWDLSHNLTVNGSALSFALNDLDDVTAPTPLNDNLLSYDTSSSQWVNKSLATLLNRDLYPMPVSGYFEGSAFVVDSQPYQKSLFTWYNYTGEDIIIKGYSVTVGNTVNDQDPSTYQLVTYESVSKVRINEYVTVSNSTLNATADGNIAYHIASGNLTLATPIVLGAGYYIGVICTAAAKDNSDYRVTFNIHSYMSVKKA